MTAHAKTAGRHTIPLCTAIGFPRGKGSTADARSRLCPLMTYFSFKKVLFQFFIVLHLYFDAAAILDRHAIGCNRRLCSRRSVGLNLPDAAIAFRAPALPQEMRATTRVFRVWCKRSVSFMSHNHMALIRSIRSLPFANRWICSNSRTESSGIDTHHHSFPTYLRLPFTSTETLLTIHTLIRNGINIIHIPPPFSPPFFCLWQQRSWDYGLTRVSDSTQWHIV